jgi:hypothetical protein
MIICCLLFVLATMSETETRHHLEGYLADVNASDGIDQREADGIAWAYFLGYVSGCGGPDKGSMVDGEWVIPVALGFGGRPMDSPIRINAKTGAIGQSGGPSFRSYRSFRLILLWGIPMNRVKTYLEEYSSTIGHHLSDSPAAVRRS